MPDQKPQFDPTKPYQVDKPKFDPNAAHEIVQSREKHNPLTSALSGLSQGATFGFGDEISGAVNAGIDKVTGDESPYGDLYRKRRDQARNLNAQASEDNPKSYIGGDIVGSVASPVGKVLAPVKGAGMVANAARIGAGGALAGAGSSSADITRGPNDLAEMGKDAALGAGLGVGTHLGLGAAGSAASKLAPDALKKIAYERAVKASIGNNKKLLKEMSKKGIVQSTGKELLEDTAATGKPAVGFFSNAESIAPEVAAKKDYYGKAIGDVGKTIDDLSPGAVKPQQIVNHLNAELDKLPDTPDTKGARDYLKAQIEYYENKGLTPDSLGPAKPMTFEETQRNKSAIKWNHAEEPNKQDAGNNVKRILGGAQEDAAAELAQNPNTPEDTKAKLALYKQLKSKWQGMNTIDQGAQKKVQDNLANRFVSPSDYGVAGAAGIASAAAGNPLPAVKAVVAGGLNKQLRERGSSMAAVSLNKLAKIIENNPESLGKFRSTIEKAASQGPQSLALTNFLLSKDPEYMKTVGQ